MTLSVSNTEIEAYTFLYLRSTSIAALQVRISRQKQNC